MLEACHGEPATLDQLASRARMTPARVVAAVRTLERDGWMERSAACAGPDERAVQFSGVDALGVAGEELVAVVGVELRGERSNAE